jgi:hypothetical protein
LNLPKTYYVAFIDILGYSNLVSDYFEVTKANTSLLMRIESIIDEAFRLDELMLKQLSSKIMFLSDSLIISIERKSTDYRELDMLFAFLSYLQSKCLNEGIYIRGAVSEGPHHEKNNKNYQVLISKALVNAVMIEKSEAIYPRIVIDEFLMRDLYKNGKKGNYVFINIEAGCHFIDFYNGILTWYHYNEKKESMNDILSKIIDDVTRQIEQNRMDKHIAEKYEWILKYLSWRCGTKKELEDLFRYEKKNYNVGCFRMMIDEQ